MESQCSIFALLFAANPVGRYLARYIPRATGKLAKGEIGTWKRSHHDPNLSSTAKSHYAAKLPEICCALQSKIQEQTLRRF